MFRVIHGKYGTRAYCPACRVTVADTAPEKSDHVANVHGAGAGIRGWVAAQQQARERARIRWQQPRPTEPTEEEK